MKLEIEITDSVSKKLQTIKAKAYYPIPGIEAPTDSEVISDLIGESYQHYKAMKPIPTAEEILQDWHNRSAEK